MRLGVSFWVVTFLVHALELRYALSSTCIIVSMNVSEKNWLILVGLKQNV